MNDVKVNIIYMLDELNTKIKKFHTIEDAIEYIRSEYKLELGYSMYEHGKSFITYDGTYAEIIEETKDKKIYRTIFCIQV